MLRNFLAPRKKIDRLTWIGRKHLLALFGAVGLSALSGWLSPVEIGVGGIVVAVNFWSLRALAGWAFQKGGKWNKVKVISGCFFKIGIMLGAMALLVIGLRVDTDVVSLLVGTSILQLIMVASIFRRESFEDGASV